MKPLLLKPLFLCVVLLCLPVAASAQGIKDPSTPHSVVIVNPPQPSRPTATPNVPTQVPAPPLGVRRTHPFRNDAHGSGSSHR
jgi:hypothetical protein